MSFRDLSSRRAVLDVFAEYDRIGQDAFLTKYRFGRSRRYFVEHNGRQYDSKAVVGAAYGRQFPDRGPLTGADFTGGERTVQKKLEELGFTMVVLPPARLG
jgi:hypothetical protein